MYIMIPFLSDVYDSFSIAFEALTAERSDKIYFIATEFACVLKCDCYITQAFQDTPFTVCKPRIRGKYRGLHHPLISPLQTGQWEHDWIQGSYFARKRFRPSSPVTRKRHDDGKKATCTSLRRVWSDTNKLMVIMWIWAFSPAVRLK